MAMIQKGYPKLRGPILYRVAFYRSIPKSWSKKKKKAAHELTEPVVTTPDTDNYVKALSDALNDIVWEDDRTVVGFSAIKAYSEQPRIVIEAWNPTNEDVLRFIPKEYGDE
jgi:Holliday junction resolvase